MQWFQVWALEFNLSSLGSSPSSTTRWLYTLGKSHNLSNLSFPICEMGDNNDAVAPTPSCED